MAFACLKICNRDSSQLAIKCAIFRCTNPIEVSRMKINALDLSGSTTAPGATGHFSHDTISTTYLNRRFVTSERAKCFPPHPCLLTTQWLGLKYETSGNTQRSGAKDITATNAQLQFHSPLDCPRSMVHVLYLQTAMQQHFESGF